MRKERNPSGESTSIISFSLLEYVLRLYQTALLEENIPVTCENYNFYTRHAIPAYVIAVAAVEAFVNEMLFSPFVAPGFDKEQKEIIKFFDDCQPKLVEKLILVPRLVYGSSIFSPGSQPYQDMYKLIQVRNYFVHYKADSGEKKTFGDLEQRKITLMCDYTASWADKLSSSEGIRCYLLPTSPQRERDEVNYTRTNILKMGE